jgi:aldose 1-epimerase
MRHVAQIEETTRDGYPAIALRAGDLAATFVPSLGMIGASLTHRGEELLGQRNGLPAYEAKGSTMGIPLLHPWANRLSGLTYEALGEQVAIDPDSPLVRLDPNGLPIHGLAASPHWRVEQRDGGLHAGLDFGAHPELLEAFPFPHTISHDIALDERGLRIETTVVSRDDDGAVPVSFGFHPYFALPGVARADWHVELPVETRLELDARGIPNGARAATDETAGPLGDRTYDDAYADVSGAFVLAGGAHRIELSFEHGYDYAQVYAPEGQDLICFEPMTAPTNALVSGEFEVADPRYSAAFRIGVSAT